MEGVRKIKRSLLEKVFSIVSEEKKTEDALLVSTDKIMESD